MFLCLYVPFISVCDQPTRSTQPGHPFEVKRNEYQPKGGDASRLRSKGKYGSCVGGRYIYIFVYCRLSNATKQENVGK